MASAALTLHSLDTDLNHVPVLPPAPAKKGWKAQAANQAPHRAIRRKHPSRELRDSPMSSAAVTRTANSETSHSRDRPGSGFTLSSFPIPGQEGPNADSLNEKLRSLTRKMSFKSDDSQFDLSLTSDENERITGLGIHQSRSIADMSIASHSRRPSINNRSTGSAKSHVRNTSGNSLGDGVGFNFKNTTNFVHPHRQTPRTYTHMGHSSRKSSRHDLYEEGSEDHAERMNSVTSDGGWQSGWSMNGSLPGSISGPSTGPDGRPITHLPILEDAGPDDIAEEEEMPEDELTRPTVEKVDSGKVLEQQIIAAKSDEEVPATLDPSNRSHTDSSVESDKSDKPDISLHKPTGRPRANTNMSSASPTFTSTARPSLDKSRVSFDKAFSLIQPHVAEPEDPAVRAANIRAARLAFEEKEAAKDRKAEEERRKKEARRSCRSRKPSNAVDSAHEERFPPLAGMPKHDSEASSPEEEEPQSAILPKNFNPLAMHCPRQSSRCPSMAPSRAPSIAGSRAPSVDHGSQNPLAMHNPRQPSVCPSVAPRRAPSIAGSIGPTVENGNYNPLAMHNPRQASVCPSVAPSRAPSIAGSIAPTVENGNYNPLAMHNPRQASVCHSVAPSRAPSMDNGYCNPLAMHAPRQPSVCPSVAPSRAPSIAASRAPSVDLGKVRPSMDRIRTRPSTDFGKGYKDHKKASVDYGKAHESVLFPPIDYNKESNRAHESALFPPIDYSKEDNKAFESALFPPVDYGRVHESALFPPVNYGKAHESALFPPMNYGKAHESALFPPLVDDSQYQQTSALWPPVDPSAYARLAQEYDEAGETDRHQVSKTKQAKGKLLKFSTWSKTRLLRV